MINIDYRKIAGESGYSYLLVGADMWERADGAILSIKGMDKRYRNNCIKMLKKCKKSMVDGDNDAAFIRELKKYTEKDNISNKSLKKCRDEIEKLFKYKINEFELAN